MYYVVIEGVITDFKKINKNQFIPNRSNIRFKQFWS